MKVEIYVLDEIIQTVKQYGDLSGLILVWDGKKFDLEHDWK